MSSWRRRMSYSKKYYKENREAILKRHKKYREENREAILKKREETREARLEYQKKYYEENREITIVRVTKYKKTTPEVSMMSQAKKRAKDKKLPFDLDLKYLRNIWPTDNICPALNIKLKRGKGKMIDSSPSLDRINSELGYVKENVQIVSMLANLIMSSATPDQVIQVGNYFKKIVEKNNAA